MAVQIQGPNLFEFVHDETRITYWPGGPDAVARLKYSGPMGRHSFAGDEIQAHESARGLEVSVTLDRVSHLRTITLKVFVPDVELDDELRRSFETVGIRETRRRTITRSAGAAMTSEPLQFAGIASVVELREPGPAQLL